MKREAKVGTRRCGVSTPRTYLAALVCTAKHDKKYLLQSGSNSLLGHLALLRVIDVSVITVTPSKLAEDIRNLDPQCAKNR